MAIHNLTKHLSKVGTFVREVYYAAFSEAKLLTFKRYSSLLFIFLDIFKKSIIFKTLFIVINKLFIQINFCFFGK